MYPGRRWMKLFLLVISALAATTLGQDISLVGGSYDTAASGGGGDGGGSGYLASPPEGFNDVNNAVNFLSYLQSKNYDAFSEPYAVGSGLDSVTLLIMLSRVSSFDQKASKFTVAMDLYVSWRDAFAFNVSAMQQSKYPLDLEPLQRNVSGASVTITIDTFTPRLVWYPNLFFPTFRKVEQSDETTAGENTLVDVDFFDLKTPLVTLWRRVVGDVACKMDYKHYPLDSNVCSIPVVFMDFQKPLKLVTKFIGPSGPLSLNSLDATVSFNSKYAGWTVPVFNKRDLTLKTVKAPGVEILVKLTRLSGTYVIRHFIPLTLITTCGICSLWVDMSVPPARVGLSITSILSLVALSFPLSADLPDTPYLTYSSIYNIICLFFAFITIICFIVVHVLKTLAAAPPPPPPATVKPCSPPAPPMPEKAVAVAADTTTTTATTSDAAVVLTVTTTGDPSVPATLTPVSTEANIVPPPPPPPPQPAPEKPPQQAPAPFRVLGLPLWQFVDLALCYFFTCGYLITIIVFFPVISTKK